MLLDLRSVQYDIDTLIKYVDDINIKTCVNTQILTAEFCAKYVLNEKYMSCVEDTHIINIDYVLKRQPHLTLEAIVKNCCYEHGI